jgi:hypothetical protein
VTIPRVVCPPLSELDTLRQPLTEGERIVLDYFLASLPSSWEIYIQPHLNGLRPDFILLHPERGIAVYEVKDWNLDAMDYFVEQEYHRPPRLMARRDGRTFSIEEHNPVAKIALYKEEIFSLYCPRLSSKSGLGAIVAGVIFPFATEARVRQLMLPIQKHYRQDEFKSLYPIIGQETLATIKDAAVKKTLRSLYTVDERMNGDIAADLRHWLVEADAAAEQRRPLMNDLSSSQKRLVTTRTATGYRRVRGAAGSGKTFVLAGRAATLAAEGKSVLVITFNITLINYILDMSVRFTQSGKVRKQIVALNFHSWCRRIAADTGNNEQYDELWTQGLPVETVLRECLPESTQQWLAGLRESEKWDAILLDEGQDFQLSWWITLRKALKQDGEALLCADRTQNIYGIAPWTEEEMSHAGFRGPWGTMEESFRLSPTMCRLARLFIDEFLGDAEVQVPEPLQGTIEYKTILKWWQVPQGAAARYCVAAMERMIVDSDPPIAFADLTCIVENERTGLEIVALLKDKRIAAVHTFGQGESMLEKYYDGKRKKQAFFKGDARVKVTTLHSFKGWESKTLVVHIGNAKTPASLALAYAGITRLKKDDFGCYLTVVCEADELAEYGRSWPVHQRLPHDEIVTQ